MWKNANSPKECNGSSTRMLNTHIGLQTIGSSSIIVDLGGLDRLPKRNGVRFILLVYILTVVWFGLARLHRGLQERSI